MFVIGRTVPEDLQDQMNCHATKGCILERNVMNVQFVIGSLCVQIIWLNMLKGT